MKAIDMITLSTPNASIPLSENINPQLYFFKHNKNDYVYSPLYNIAALLSKEEYKFVIEHPHINRKRVSKHYQTLVNSFIYKDKKDSDTLVKNRYKSNSIEALYIISTSLCNLRCGYCFIFGGEGNRIISERKLAKDTPTEIDTKVVEYLIKKIKPKTLLLFGWGEPTMAFSKIKTICNSIKDQKIKINIITNGVYFSKREEIVKYLIKKDIGIQLSFDGTPEYNDKYRVISNGLGSSSEILKTIIEIKKYGPLWKFSTVRLTISKDMEDHILDFVIYLSKLGFKEIGMEPVEIFGRASDSMAVDMTKLTMNIAQAVIYGKKHGINVIVRLLPAASGRTMRRYGCGLITGRAVSLSLDNSLYVCDDPLEVFRVGKVYSTKKGYRLYFNNKKLNKIINERDGINFLECENCPVKCGGGCAKESLNYFGSFGHGGESEDFCNARKEALFNYIIQSLN